MSNSLTSFTLLRSSLCLSLLSDNRMLKISLCLNISGDTASNLSQACCIYEVPPLDLYGYRSIGNGKSPTISTTDQEISVPSTGTSFQAYSANNTPSRYFLRLTLSTEFIFCVLFNYLWKISFLIDFYFHLATECNGISKVSWKFFLKITAKISSASTTIIFGIPNGTKTLPKYHHVTWYDNFLQSIGCSQNKSFHTIQAC